MNYWAVNFFMSDESAMPWYGKAQDAEDALSKAQQHFEEAIEGLTAVACDPLDEPPTVIPSEGEYMYQIVDQSAAAQQQRDARRK